MNRSPEYVKGALAALCEAKHAILQTRQRSVCWKARRPRRPLVNLMNLVIDPLIQKYTAMEANRD